MIGNGERCGMACLHEHDVVAGPGRFPAGTVESPDDFSPAQYRQCGHQAKTSTCCVSTVTGRPRAARTSRQTVIASRIFASASSLVAPWLTQPGMDGHSTI